MASLISRLQGLSNVMNLQCTPVNQGVTKTVFGFLDGVKVEKAVKFFISTCCMPSHG